jgi:hypothetical protein
LLDILLPLSNAGVSVRHAHHPLSLFSGVCVCVCVNNNNDF